MKLLKTVLALIGLAFAGLLAFLYMMAHPKPTEPAFIRKIRFHPSAVGEYLALAARGVFEPRLLRSGATRLEKHRSLPGDELLSKPAMQKTRAITIDAPSADVWPWIVQMGGGRAGWYWWVPLSEYPEYEDVNKPPDEILPQFQHLEVGDALSDGGPYVTEERGNWEVVSIERNRHLVLFAGRDVMKGPDFDPEGQKPEGLWFVSSWAFVLEPFDGDKTRLTVRVRGIGGPAWLFLPMLLIFGHGDTVAHSTMLAVIKERAERSSRARRAQALPGEPPVQELGFAA